MPLIGNSIIGANGIVLGAPATVGTLPLVSSLGPPPVVADSLVRQWLDGAVQVVTVGPTNVRPGVGATETFRLSGGLISAGAGQDSTVIGRGAAAPAADAIAIGRGASTGAAATDSVAIGRGASAAGTPAIAIGAGASAPAVNTISIGGTSLNASGAIVIGASAFAQSNGGSPQLLAIGVSANAGRNDTGAVSMAIGSNSVARIGDVVIGHSASSSASTSNNLNVIIGNAAVNNTSQAEAVCIGWSRVSTGIAVVSIGARGGSNGNHTIALGWSSRADGEQTIVIGSNLQTSLTNHAFIGGPNTDISTFVIGRGDTFAGAPAARTMRFTNASGTNLAAGGVVFIAPRGTGNAASAGITFQVGIPQASGTTLHPVLTAATLTHTVTAGQTALSVYDVDSGVTQRVLVGAAGTGPGGVGRALYLA